MLSTLPLDEIESESLKAGRQNVRLRHIKWDSILQTGGQAGKQDAPGYRSHGGTSKNQQML